MLGFTGRDIIQATEAGRTGQPAAEGRRPLSELAARIADEAVGPV